MVYPGKIREEEQRDGEKERRAHCRDEKGEESEWETVSEGGTQADIMSERERKNMCYPHMQVHWHKPLSAPLYSADTRAHTHTHTLSLSPLSVSLELPNTLTKS